MITVAYYFLQVIVCSAVMMAYYWLALRNNRFHQYNRFYLLAAAALSWIVPLVRIRWQSAMYTEGPDVTRLLSVVAGNNTRIDKKLLVPAAEHGNWLSAAEQWLPFLYLVVSAVLSGALVLGLLRLYRIARAHEVTPAGNVLLVRTRAAGTPYSFFRYIFWNEDIDAASEEGSRIMQHELTHVRQLHSADKIFLRIVVIAGWFNPVFWIIQREMEMVHEFIADKRAVHDGDTGSLARMLLVAAYPDRNFGLVHPFFFSPVKRRLQMLSKLSDPRFSYLRRLMVMPVLASVVILFAFRSAEAGATRYQGNGAPGLPQIVLRPVSAVSLEKRASPEEQKPGPENLPSVITTSPKAETVIEEYAAKQDTVPATAPPANLPARQWQLTLNEPSPGKATPLVVIDTKKSAYSDMLRLDPDVILEVNVIKGETALSEYGDEGKNGVIEILTKTHPAPPLYVVDGKRMRATYGLDHITPNDIKSVTVLSGRDAEPRFGPGARSGAILITTRNGKMQIVSGQ